MAEPSMDSAIQDDSNKQSGNPATAAAAAQQREERIKAIREKQSEERQRKLEELKQQAQATQKFREQQEEERRRRLEEQRQRDLERRSQVEERKKAILDAEKERRDVILRRNQDRDVRLEMKRRNERSSMAFAFGSSTPRMLEPVSPAPVTYWTSRRSTSTTNVMSSSMHVRTVSVDRDVPDEIGAAKRASSVFALDQPSQGDILMTQSSTAVLGGPGPDGRRRRTDIMPTIPTHRDVPSPSGPIRPGSSRSSISHRTSDGTSGELQSRSMSKSMSHLATPPKRLFASKNKISDPPKMAKSTTSMSTGHLGPAPRRKTSDSVTPAPRMTRAEKLRQQKNAAAMKKDNDSGKNGLRSGEQTPSSPTRPLSALSHQSSLSTASSLHHVRARTAPTSARRPRPMSIAVTGMSAHTSQETVAKSKETKEKTGETPARRVSSGTITRPPRARSADVKDPPPSKAAKVPQKTARAAASGKTEKKQDVSQPEKKETETVVIENVTTTEVGKGEETSSVAADEPATDGGVPEQPEKKLESPAETEEAAPIAVEEALLPAEEKTQEPSARASEVIEEESSPAKKIITSEEEAKAALAEKRRLAREQMEREAEAERLRLEAEQRAEEERKRQEELEQKLAEEELERLAKEAQRAEEERLQKAIEEAARREEEERLRREEELRQKAEKEQAERKQREEAERLRRETEERLRREEEERQERRKRVEAIMSRTRGKGGANSKSTNGVEDKNGTTNQDSVPFENGSQSTNGSRTPQANSSADYPTPDLLTDVVSQPDANQSSRSSEKAELIPAVSLLTNADDVNSNSGSRGEQNDVTQLLA